MVGQIPAENARIARPRQTPLRRWALMTAAALFVALLVIGCGMRVVAIVSGSVGDLDDFRQYWGGASSIVSGEKLYSWAGEGVQVELDHYKYPPVLAFLLAPMAWLVADYGTARWAWLGFSVLCLALGAVLLWRTTGLRADGPRALALVALLSILFATVWALGLGQLSPQLLLLLSGALAAEGARRPVLAGALTAIATGLKMFPALLGGYFLLRRQWRACLAAIGTGLALIGLSLLVLGWEPYQQYLSILGSAHTRWFGGPFNISLMGFFSRLFADTGLTRPIVEVPAVARGAIALSTAALFAATALGVWRAGSDDARARAAFGLTVVASLLAAPINGQYNLVIALLPLAVAVAHVQGAWPRHLRWLLVTALLLTLPNELGDLGVVQELYLAGDPQLMPQDWPWRVGWGNLLISGPFFGLLALWGLLLRICTEPPRADA